MGKAFSIPSKSTWKKVRAVAEAGASSAKHNNAQSANQLSPAWLGDGTVRI